MAPRIGVIHRLCAGLLLSALLPWAHAHADGPPLWEVQGAHNRVYLLGSIHVLKPGQFRLDGALARAWDDAEQVYMEVSLDELEPMAVAQVTASLAVDPQGRSLDDLMGPDAAEARRLATRRGIDLTILERFEPWFAGITVMSLELAREGYAGDAGVEQEIGRLASAAGKPVHGFETVEQQLRMLDGLPLPLQRRFLLQSLAEAGQTASGAEQLMRAWRSGDVPALSRELEDEFSDFPELYAPLVRDRNVLWTRAIGELLHSDQDYLVVVGALHLVGRDSVVALLGQAGYKAVRR